jgi:hypothetical protein
MMLDKLIELVRDFATKAGMVAADVWPHVARAYWGEALAQAVMLTVMAVVFPILSWRLWVSAVVLADTRPNADWPDGAILRAVFGVLFGIAGFIAIVGFAFTLPWAVSALSDPTGRMVLDLLRQLK